MSDVRSARLLVLAFALAFGDPVACDTYGGRDCGDDESSCDELAALRATHQAEYESLLAEEDFEALPAVSACVQRVVDLQMTEDGSCGLSRCSEICTLHNCEPLGVEECVPRCEQQREALGLSDEDLDRIIHNAAGTPGVCTCDACGYDLFEFCEAMWECRMG